MKFSCDRCGKKYATADVPQPGRVYKLKCKACGHLIVVKGSAALASAGASPAPTPVPSAANAATPLPEAPPEIELVVGAPEPHESTPRPSSIAPPTMTMMIPSLGAPEPTAAPAPTPAPAPPADGGYVDIFADGSTGMAPLPPEPTLTPAPTPPPPPADPFLAAARASLPDGFAGKSTDDPFAPIRAELEAAANAETRPEPPSPPLAAPKIPQIPKPPPAKKNGVPIALIGAGLAVLLGILAFVLLRGSAPEPRKPTTPVVARPSEPVQPELAPRAPAPPEERSDKKEEKKPEPAAARAEPPPAAKPEPPAEEKRSDKKRPEPKPEPKREVKREEPKARPEPKPEPPPPPPKPVVAKAEPAPAPREQPQVDLPEAATGLSDEQIQKVLVAARKAFDGCIANSAKTDDVKLDGRKANLRLNIQPNGTVTYPTLDDVTLNGTELGSCLKSAARLMVFPKFKGDPVRIEVPFTLR